MKKVNLCLGRIGMILGLTMVLFSCQKEKNEALEIRPINNRTILKKHTKGTDYIIQNLEVNAELIIEAGVTIDVVKGGSINIGPKGRLTISGIGTEKVIIKGKDDQPWKGIQFVEGGGFLSGLELINASAGGEGKGAITTSGESEITLNGVEILFSGKSSALVANGKSIITINKACEIRHAHIPYQKELFSEIIFKSDVVLNDIGLRCILIKSEHGNGITLSQNWVMPKKDLPYLFKESVHVAGRLIIAGGTRVLMGIGTSIFVLNKGELIAEGSPIWPISFSCESPTRDWNGISIISGRIRLVGAHISHVLSKNNDQGVVTIAGYAEANIQYCNMVNNDVTCAIVVRRNGIINANANSLNQFGGLSRVCSY